MALVVLAQSDMALLADPVRTRVGIPHLVAAPLQRRFEGTAVRFAGDQYPTPFYGEGRGLQRQLTGLYGGSEHEQLAALVRLLELAASHVDPRLLFRTHIGQVADLDPIMAVSVFGYEVTPGRGQLQTLTMTVDAVQWDGTE